MMKYILTTAALALLAFQTDAQKKTAAKPDCHTETWKKIVFEYDGFGNETQRKMVSFDTCIANAPKHTDKPKDTSRHSSGRAWMTGPTGYQPH